MRGGTRGLWLLVGGVFIGAAAVALVGATAQSLVDGARHGALEAVGGDLSLRLFHRPPRETELAVIRREGDLSISTELRPMARPIREGQTVSDPVLVELKGVDRQYPLYGKAETRSGRNLFQSLEQQNGEYGAVADPALFVVMNLEPGDQVQIGNTRYRLRGVIDAEPDRAFRAFTLGPRIMVLNESLTDTGLINEGAEVYYYTRVKLPSGSDMSADARAALTRIDQVFPDSGWRIVNAHDGVPGVERTLAMAHVLLLFIGLGVMLVGGAGISGAVRTHVAGKMEIIAILKSLGAPPGVVTLAIGLEILAATSLGALIGVGLGASGPALAASVLVDQLPFTLNTTPGLKPLLAAGLFSVLVAALFTWWPLKRVQDTKPRTLLRIQVAQAKGRSGLKGCMGAGMILSGLVALVFWVSPMPLLTVAFLAGALVLAAFYYALGISLSGLARALTGSLVNGKSANLRLALGNLYRAGAPTGPVVMALGLTLTLLVALDGIGLAASRHIQKSLPHSAPDLVAFSLKTETATRLGAELAASGLVERQRIMPFLHARVQAIGGVPVRDLQIPRSQNWVIRGDRGVSFATSLPDGARWEGAQADQTGFSLDAGVAKKLGLDPGDTITLNTGGQVRSGPVLNFREVDWTGLDLDFPIIATPATFSGIPYSLAASLKAGPGKKADLEAFVKSRFPDVPLIRVADVLQSLGKALETILAGLKGTALICGLAALMVLAGSILQSLEQRTVDAAMFKVLGARRRQLLGQLMVEFVALGSLVALAAVPFGLGVAWGVARAAGLGSLDVSWTGSMALAVAAILVTLAVGLLVTLGVYSASPTQVLRRR